MHMRSRRFILLCTGLLWAGEASGVNADDFSDLLSGAQLLVMDVQGSTESYLSPIYVNEQSVTSGNIQAKISQRVSPICDRGVGDASRHSTISRFKIALHARKTNVVFHDNSNMLSDRKIKNGKLLCSVREENIDPIRVAGDRYIDFGASAGSISIEEKDFVNRVRDHFVTSWLVNVAANVFRESSIIMPSEPGYAWEDNIPGGMEVYYQQYSSTRSRAEAQALTSQLTYQAAAERRISEATLWQNLVASLAASLADPLTYLWLVLGGDALFRKRS